jgi:rSAM/selenodomain-associated transferase 1
VDEAGVSGCANALIVMARYPEPGMVKTRLAASIGDAGAAEIYRAFLRDLGARLPGHRSWVLRWAFEPAGSRFCVELAAGADAFAQVEGSLGARMLAAMARGLRDGARHVVLIGSDVPHVPLSILEEAFGRLSGGADLVLGPAEDGGYYLIGARSVPAVFEGIRWGGPDVLAATLAAARRRGIEPELLETQYDVDDVGTVGRLEADLTAGRIVDLPATRAALERVRSLGYI